MDQQRQFLQAYEYLCHIGEAKEWIEKVVCKSIPPIIQLEEALRDGVTLAEIVQAVKPEKRIKIFDHPKLQYRHSDNIAVFFNFLAEIELPDLFRFEFIDLYDKKNIPKVIYCIHALSWLLFRLGMIDFRIGNLVGRLKFEDHELEEVQKGLERSGVSMPSFSGMSASFGAEAEPEPVESEEDRIERELKDHQETFLDLQAQLRGCLIRLRLGDQMQRLWDSESSIILLQSRVRGDFQREVYNYHLSMRRCAVELQSASRGFLVRVRESNRGAMWKQQSKQLTLLQAAIRARESRKVTQELQEELRRRGSRVRQFQAATRGVLARHRKNAQKEASHRSQKEVIRLQAAIRGNAQRRKQLQQQKEMDNSQKSIELIQAACRGRISRAAQAKLTSALEEHDNVWRTLQAFSRAGQVRVKHQETRKRLAKNLDAVICLQTTARGNLLRTNVQQIRSSLHYSTDSTRSLQASARALIVRARLSKDMQAIRQSAPALTTLQGHIRGHLSRERRSQLLAKVGSDLAQTIKLQALARAMMVRVDVGSILSHLEEEESIIEAVQSLARGCLVRAKFAEKMKFFKENMEKVVKVQSFVRGKLQGQAYKSLTCGKNPPVGTVKGFVHLLNDSDFDFDEEVEFERLRKTVVQHVRQNEMADQYISQLDIKIALLVKNKITLDEVVKHQKHFGGSVGNLLTMDSSSKDAFDLKALNKHSRRKLEQYQDLFCVLQTQPQYLANLFRQVRELATAEKESERIKHLVMGLFGYAQKRREEFYLLKVITRAIKEEVEHSQSLQDYLRGNFFWTKVFSAYVKSPKDRKFLRDVLGPLVKEYIVANADLDLESDPLQIYHTAIDNEQLRTGQRSHRARNIDPRDAIKDPETKKMFISHLVDLRELSDLVFSMLAEFLHKMPYGVRYVAQQIFQCLCSRFPHEAQEQILQIVGHWLWRSYLQPALLEPTKFGVVDQGLSPEQKKNLGEVSKVLGQIASGRLFGADGYLHPLNNYIRESIDRLAGIWADG